MYWHFSPLPRDQVETEVTQRDQFDNDDVDISETIVREFIQNSLDAATNDPYQVRVVFRWVNAADGLKPEYFSSLFDGHREHAEAADIAYAKLDFGTPSALIIEDYGTTGLTGEVAEIDDGNFCDFWRRHGKSHKSGKNRGRWGLGKLVYSCTSQAGVFFGATNRQGESEVLVMGQTVLNLRQVNGQRYPPHAFFADIEGIAEDRIPVPIKDRQFVDDFVSNFSLDRRGRPGLSIVIPLPRAEFSREKMIEVAIVNYFYPLVTGQLVLAFGNIEINKSNVRELAKKYASSRLSQINLLFDFIEEVYQAQQSNLLRLRPTWASDRKLDVDDFDAETLEAIRKQFASGQLVGVYLPITIKPKAGPNIDTGISVYIKRPEGLERGVDLYVRGGLTLPNEAKIGDRIALGAMLAEEEPICSFLGDAENAAHTRWNTHTEKLSKNYRNTQATVAVIKRSIIQLYDLLAEVTEEVDELALHNFFWFDEPERGKNQRRVKPKPPAPMPIIPRSEPIMRLSQTPGGFTLVSTDSFTEEKLPRDIKIQVAYEVTNGNAFKKYSPHDFKLGKDGIECIAPNGAVKLISAKHNAMELQVIKVPFRLQVQGFDVNRDLKVNVK